MYYWPKFLTYGNWGGPGWSGGKFVHDPKLVDWTVTPVDPMDRAFKAHDWGIQHGLGWKAHLSLTTQLERQQPPTGTWARTYRIVAIAIFYTLAVAAYTLGSNSDGE